MSEEKKGEKIQKVLAAAGLSSRRGAEELIRRGLVKVNGEVVENPAVRVDPERDRIEYRGRPVRPQSGLPRAILLYKTSGYVTSAHDPHNPRTVYRLLPEGERDSRKWLYAGRLDKDTEGLLLFTDSGELVQKLTHPSRRISKHYRVTVQGRPAGRDLRKLERGITDEGRLLRMDRVEIVSREGGDTVLEVVLHQGEKRQIKRMFAHIGCRVSRLLRTRFGPLTLEGLEPGCTRRLSKREVKELLAAVSV